MQVKGIIRKYGARTYYITWRSREHVFKMWNSFGISVSILDHLVKEMVDTIVIKTDWGEYTCNIWDYLNSPLEYDNRGDVQKHLPLSQFTFKPSGQQTLDQNVKIHA